MRRRAALLGLLACQAPASGWCQTADDGWEPGDATAATVSPEVRGDTRATRGNGVYGRFDGDIDLGAHAGALIGDGVAGLTSLSAHYYWMAGLYTRYADAFGSEALGTRRSVGFGVSVRPVFVPRWAMDAQIGNAVLDLAIDSVAIGLGAYFADAGQSLGEQRGFEASIGVGLPLMGRAEGLWLDAQGLARWPDADEASAEPAGGLLVSLGWHWMVQARR